MEEQYWASWSAILARGRLTGVLLTLLEGSGPIKGILSQGIMAAMPFVGHSTSFKAFAEMLEDSDSSGSFAEYLRQRVS